jgi:Tfp pilus assembly protein PilE
MKRKQAGMILILEMLVVCAIVLILIGIPLLNLQQIVAANNGTAVITVLRATNRAEGFFARVYGEGYQTPAYLAIQPTVAQSCLAPSLLGNQDAAAYSNVFAGYQLVFTPGASSGQTGAGCTAPGLASYTITATPAPALNGTNSYFTDNTGVLRCDAPTVTATAASPVCGF